MSPLVYRICALLTQVLADVPVGTNLGLLHLFLALLSGRFLHARGAMFAALDSLGLAPASVRRSSAALCYGGWNMADLLLRWQQAIAQEGRFVPACYEGVRPVACDLTAFFRPHLQGLDSKHYRSTAGKALPAVCFGVGVAVGRIGKVRFAVPRLFVRRKAGESESALQTRLVAQAARTLAVCEALIVDAGFARAAQLGSREPALCRPRPPDRAAQLGSREPALCRPRPPDRAAQRTARLQRTRAQT